jgi:signal peptidase I
VKTRRRSPIGSIVELVIIVAVALGLALGIQAFIVKPYRIPSGSMEPTLSIGQRVLVDRIGNDFSKPHLGEIVVFHPPAGANDEPPQCGDPNAGGDTSILCDKPTTQEATSINFIKRVVGLPGDRLQVTGGHVIRNGVPEKDSYINPCGFSGQGCTWRGTITVPAGDYFMMGDNRGESDDSRYWGPVPKSWIIGGAFLTYWPPDRIGFL